MEKEILQVGITESQHGPEGLTWGRVYVDYIDEGKRLFAFKNWLFGSEYCFYGEDSFEDERAFTWFENKRRTVVEDYNKVLSGDYDELNLTPSNYKANCGTPSRILKKLLLDIDNGICQHVETRRGWFK